MAKRNKVAQPDPELIEYDQSALKVRLVSLDSLRPDPMNAREHNERNLGAIRDSLAAFGQQKPIVIDSDGVIVAGEGTWRAAKELNWPKIAVVVTELKGEKKVAFGLADNRLSELSFFDEAKLLAQLSTLKDVTLVSAAGFDEGDVAEMAETLTRPSDTAGAGDGRGASAKSGDKSVTVRLTLAVASAELIERAIAAVGLINREDCLLAICKHYMDKHGGGK